MSLTRRFKKKNEYPFSKSLLHELSELFFCEGYKLYSGQNSLSLTAQFLSHFLTYYETYTSNHTQNIIRNSLRFNINSAAREMNYIRECFEKVQSLKILVDVRYPLENPVKLFPFNKIKVLVIKKCPINMIHGLKKLRRQLQTLVLNYSLSVFDEAIAQCGGDETNGEEWHSLDELDLSYNFMSEVNDSQWSLVHSITKLDLSHNQLCEERTDFRELDKLLQINLGYNFLKNIPFFHPHAMGSLHTLILRNNNLSALDGIETLRQLSVLDLGYNCLDLHTKLDRIDALHFLRNLQLTGNPLSYHKKHRQFTLMKLSPAIDVDAFILDDVSLSISESKEFLKNAQLTASYQSSISSPSHMNYFSSSSSQSHSSRGGRRISSIRTIELDDTDSQREYAPIEDYPHYAEIKQKEVLRTQLGPAWLPSQDSQEESPQKINRSKNKHTRHILPAQTKLLLDGDTSSYSKPESPVVKSKLTTTRKSSYDNPLPESQQGYQIEALGEYSPMQEHPEPLSNNSPTLSQDDESSKTPINEEPIDVSPQLIDEEQYLVHSYDTEDEESQREPFFISLSGNRLYELNYEGKATQEYDMNCLLSVIHSEKKSSSGEGEKKQILTLKFNYERRDMRKRDYIFEKAENFKNLIEKLSEIAANNANNPIKNTYQCLKCNSVVDKTHMLYSYSAEDVTKSRGSDSINCPKCGSDQLTGDSKLTVRECELLDSGPGFTRKLTPAEIRSSLPIQRDLIDNLNSENFKPSSASPKSYTQAPTKNGNAVGKKESIYFSENKFSKYRGKQMETEILTAEDTQESDFERVLLRKASVTPPEEDFALESTSSRRDSVPEVDLSSIKACDKVVGKGSFRRRNKQPCPKLSESMIANDGRGLTRTHVDDSNSVRGKPLSKQRVNTSSLEELDEGSSQSDRRNSTFSCGSSIFPTRSSTGPEGIGLPFSFHDPSYIRHDFKLYIEVKLFESNTEEFLSQIRCTAVQTRQKEEFQCLLIISTQAAYICQVKGAEEYAPAEWLSKLIRISLNSLFFIDIGLHGQTLQLEFSNVKNGSFVFITRDTLRTKIFVASLSGYVSKLKQGCLQRVGPDLQTIPNFRAGVLGDSSPTFSEKYVLGLRLYEMLRYSSDLIKTHRHHKRSIHNTISGSKLVDFLIQRNEATTIEDACLLIQQCIDCRVLNPLEPMNDTFDLEKGLYYRFSMDEFEPNASNGRPTHIEMLTEIEQLEIYCLLYQIEYKYTNPIPEKNPIGFAITEDFIFLVQQNFQWPLPRLQPPPQLGIRWRQFELKDKRRLTDIEKVLINSNSQSISFVFSTESIHDTPHYEEWNLCTESSRMAEMIVVTIKNIWEKQYNVELNILITDKPDD